MICQKCGFKCEDEEIPNNFYAHGTDIKGNIRRDTICKYCRREESKIYQAAKRKGELIYRARPFSKNLSSTPRNTKEKFLHYMTHNPVYFKEQFGREPTEENIIEEYYETQRLIDTMDQQTEAYNELDRCAV